jgi:hypothetical protein
MSNIEMTEVSFLFSGRLAELFTYLDNTLMRNVDSNLTPVAGYCNNPINDLFSSVAVLS